MNTHDIEPLKYGGDKNDDYVTGWNDCYAAIEADRKRTTKQLSAYESLVASLEAKCTHMRKMYDELKDRTNPDLLASERAANAILTAELEADHQRRGEVVVTKTPEGEIIAVTRQDDEGKILSVIAESDRKRRGEPVAVIRYERNTPGSENEMPRVISCNRLPDGDYPVFTAPQPAEPSRSEPVGYIMPTALKQLKAGGNAIVGGVSQGWDVPIYTAPHPAESISDEVTAWRERFPAYEYRPQDDCVALKLAQPAEPVKEQP